MNIFKVLYGILFGFGLFFLMGVTWYLADSSEENKNIANSSVQKIQNTPTFFDRKIGYNNKYSIKELENWKRKEGPVRIGLQVGHLDNQDVPEELSGISSSASGAQGGGVSEQETVHKIVLQAADLLEERNIIVDVLPAVVPPGYLADAFISVHADGNTNQNARGYKLATPWRDYAETSEKLESFLYDAYGKNTQLPTDNNNITRRMRGYYAFNWMRYEHAIHPKTPAVILETGYMSNWSDRQVIVNQSQVAAQGIAEGIVLYLESQGLLDEII